MYFLKAISLVVCFVTLVAATSPISSQTYNNFVRFAQFSSAAYQGCSANVNNIVHGATVVYPFSQSSTDTQGYIAVDTANSQIILAFRGSTSEADFVNTDADVVPVSYSTPISGILNYCLGCTAHQGFYNAWNSVSSGVLNEIRTLHSQHPSFTIIVTGHSLGGALTPFAALAIKGLNLGANIQIYSYGQPRSGDSPFANYVNNHIGTSNVFRATHVNDAVPELIPQLDGLFQHHSTEYFIHADPSSVGNVWQCSGNEDGSCLNSQGLSWSTTFDLFSSNSPHHVYFGIGMGDSC